MRWTSYIWIVIAMTRALMAGCINARWVGVDGCSKKTPEPTSPPVLAEKFVKIPYSIGTLGTAYVFTPMPRFAWGLKNDDNDYKPASLKPCINLLNGMDHISVARRPFYFARDKGNQMNSLSPYLTFTCEDNNTFTGKGGKTFNIPNQVEQVLEIQNLLYFAYIRTFKEYKEFVTYFKWELVDFWNGFVRLYTIHRTEVLESTKSVVECDKVVYSVTLKRRVIESSLNKAFVYQYNELPE